MRRLASLLLLAPLTLTPPRDGDDFSTGLRAWQQGDFHEAFAAFGRAEQAAGDHATAELLYDEALAALQTGAIVHAEAAADRAAARGGPPFALLCEFVRGNVAFRRAEIAEAETLLPGAKPGAFDRAIAFVESARRSWQASAVSCDDWPQARRNIERALRKLEALEAKRAEAQKNSLEDARKRDRAPDSPKEPPPPADRAPPPPPPSAEPEPFDPADVREPELEPIVTELRPEQVQQLFEKLREKEQTKRELRRARRPRVNADVERDW